MIRTAALVLVLATPAAAQDADPHNQIVEGVMACLSGGGQVDLTDNMLSALSWTKDAEFEDGLVAFNPGTGEATQVYMATDGSFCHVEAFSTGSAVAQTILQATLDTPEGAKYTLGTDAMGCTQLTLASGDLVTVTSGGNDPVCNSDTDAGIRFEFSTNNE